MRVLAAIGVLAIAGVIAAAIYFFGGYYNVAASQPDHPAVAWLLQNVRAASIARHAGNAEPPIALTDAANVQAGARAFNERGCVNCHGAPGAGWAKFSEGMQPGPPDLKEVARAEPAHLFWAIKNGINMTGMPAFAAIEVPDQEIWTIVAFVKRLPKVSPEEFKTWTAAPAAFTGAK